MSSAQEYLRKMETGQLQHLLRQYDLGTMDFSVDAVLLICSILAERDPDKPDVKEAFRRFCREYMD